VASARVGYVTLLKSSSEIRSFTPKTLPLETENGLVLIFREFG